MKTLPLIALVALAGVSACGGDDDIDEIEDDGTIVETAEDFGDEDMAYGEEEIEPVALEEPGLGGESMVTVTVSGVEADAGEVFVALQTEQNFAQTGGEYTQVAEPQAGIVTVMFEDVEPGSYAVAAFQDTDGDGSLTLEEMGPTEPWGFSGNVDRTAMPEFADAAIEVGDMTTEATVNLLGGL